MAKTTKKRRYYRRVFRRYKNVSQNYFRVKAEFNDSIYFPTRLQLARGGPVGFGGNWNDVNVPEANKGLLNLNRFMTTYPYTATLQGLFSYYKITGIRVEISPDPRNYTLPTTVIVGGVNLPNYSPVVYFSYRAGNNTIQTLNEAKSNNQSVILSPTGKINRYWKVYGASGAYTATTEALDGAFSVVGIMEENAQAIEGFDTFQSQPSYKVKISIYLLYKQSKA